MHQVPSRYCILFFLLLLGITSASRFGQLSVTSPKALISQIGDSSQDIDFILANYGEVHFGKVFHGEVVVADPITACVELFNKISKPEETIVLAERGECSFVTKSHNAQIAGASLLITMNEQKQQNLSSLMIVDDGSGLTSSLKIPSIMINYREGALIRDYLKQNPNDSVVLTLKFEWPQEKSSEITTFISVSDTYSYDMLNELKPFLQKLDEVEENYYTLKVHYVLWHCVDCELYDDYQSNYNPNCWSGGRYCAPDPDGDGPQTGRDIVNQILVQLCLRDLSLTVWWDYVVRYRSNCLIGDKNIKDCSNEIIQAMDIPTQTVIDCVEASFEGTSRELSDNKLLREEKQAQDASHIVVWPQLLINKMTYRGNLKGDFMFEAICDSLLEAPSVCTQVKEEKPQVMGNIDVKEPSSMTSVLFCTLVGLTAFLGVFFLYQRRRFQRDMHKEMTLQISSAVSHYVRMHDSSFDLKLDRDRETRKLVEAEYY